MSIRDRMNILFLSIVIHYCLIKTSDLTFIRCHNVQLQSCLMVVTTSVRAPSWHDDVCACALTRFVPYRLHKFNLRHHFHICGYSIFPYLNCAYSYPPTMSAYNLSLYFSSMLWRHCFVPFPIFFTLYPVISTFISTMDSIISPPDIMLDSNLYWFEVNLTKFSTNISQVISICFVHIFGCYNHPPK